MARVSHQYRLHRASGRAFVVLAGKRIYLGKFGSEESRDRYRLALAEFKSTGRAPSPFISRRHARAYRQRNVSPVRRAHRRVLSPSRWSTHWRGPEYQDRSSDRQREVRANGSASVLGRAPGRLSRRNGPPGMVPKELQRQHAPDPPSLQMGGAKAVDSCQRRWRVINSRSTQAVPYARPRNRAGPSRPDRACREVPSLPHESRGGDGPPSTTYRHAAGRSGSNEGVPYRHVGRRLGLLATATQNVLARFQAFHLSRPAIARGSPAVPESKCGSVFVQSARGAERVRHEGFTASARRSEADAKAGRFRTSSTVSVVIARQSSLPANGPASALVAEPTEAYPRDRGSSAVRPRGRQRRPRACSMRLTQVYAEANTNGR